MIASSLTILAWLAISGLSGTWGLFFPQPQVGIYKQPEQIHISYGGKPSRMYITWVTLNSTDQSFVEYGTYSDTILKFNRIKGAETEFVDGGSEKRKIYIHRVLLSDLQPGVKYRYRVGGQTGWSSLFGFTAIKSSSVWSPKFAVYGDFGLKNARSLSKLQTEAQMGMYDMFLHVGDMAYNMFDDNARYGDQWLRSMEPIAAIVPYMVTPGNHEGTYNFSNYVNRFTMPNSVSNHFYSYDIGPAHIISFSTEFYFFMGYLQIKNQYKWLEADLQAANANRHAVPWIITLAHRPMYCSTADSDDCTKMESITRTGYIENKTKVFGLEELFFKYGVDLEIWAHEHSYERLWPTYNRTIYNGSVEPYVNPLAPVHITTGSAVILKAKLYYHFPSIGCQEDTDAFKPDPSAWSAFRSTLYGYSRMFIKNSTHMYWQQVSTDSLDPGKVIDELTLVKEHHGPYKKEDLPTDGIYIPMDFKRGKYKKCEKCADL